MDSDRIKELHEQTAYPESVSVYKALLQVWNECQQEHNKETEKQCDIHVVSKRFKAKKVSSDGVFFICDNCGFQPQMASSTDDLLIMHFCPKCGSEFE